MTYKGKRPRGFTAGQVAALVLAWLIVFIAITTHAGSEYTGKPAGQLLTETVTQDPDAETGNSATDPNQQANENQLIEAALLAKAHKIENCTVTWYLNSTCGKTPDNLAYGITASGEPTATHCTVATDPGLIPIGSDVCVQYADGSTEWFRATDTGVSGAHVDVFTDDREQAVENGSQLLTVWYIPPVEVDVN